jgi:hypothetical protein
MADDRQPPPNGGPSQAAPKRRVLPSIAPEIFRDQNGASNKFKALFPDVPLDPSVARRGKYIDFSSFVKSVNDHRDKHGSSVEADYREENMSKLPFAVAPTRNQSANQPNAAWHHFYDPEVFRSTGVINLIIVETDEQAETLRSRRFVEMPSRTVHGRHSSDSDLPHPLPPPSAMPTEAAPAVPVLPLHQQPPPPENEPPKLPLKVPELRKEGPGNNRDKLIECFEVKVVDEKNGCVYSPMRRWANFNTTSESGVYNSRLRGYYAVKKNLVPGETKIAVLKKAASNHSEILAKKQELKDAKQKFSFFRVCLELYQSEV